MNKNDLYKQNRYLCKVVRVIDGDTVEVLVDLGFHASISLHIRMEDVFAHEVRGGSALTKHLAKNEKAFLQELVDANEGYFCLIATGKQSFTRWVGRIFDSNKEDINLKVIKYIDDHYPIEHIEG